MKLSKHIALLLVFGLLFCGKMEGQFNTNLGNTTTLDKVGVGTTTPAAQTEIVTSNSNLSPASPFNLLITKTDNVGVALAGCPLADQPYFQIRSKEINLGGGGYTTYNHLTFDIFANLGLGTDKPESKLHVNAGSGYNIKAVTFGTLAPTNISTGSRKLFFVNRLGNTTYNAITKSGDNGLFWNDGQNHVQTSGFDCNNNPITLDNYYNNILTPQNINATNNGGFVIAPEQDPNAVNPVPTGIRIDNLGNVAICSDKIASGYRLSVNGKIIAEELTVKLKVNWPDYVFTPKYKMQSLYSIERYIKINHCLPGYANATSMEKTGLNLGEIQVLHQKSIEELYLIVIEQQKQLDLLKKQLAAKL